MTTSNEITLDHVAQYFSLQGELMPLDIAPTATGGAGINNIDMFPPPQPAVPSWRTTAGTEYTKKYLDKERNEQFSRNEMLGIPGSTVSINTIDDVDDMSTALGDIPQVNELDNEATRQIYSTYFDVAHRTYDSELTITRYREEILQQLNINPVVIIQGPTGCGKTTQVPQFIIDYHQSRGTYCNIVVTQPRKIAATSIARRVCQERKWQLGTIVGYQVAMDPKTSSDTRLCYVTTGILLEKLVNAKRMDMYTHVIIDEVHERNQDIDFALLLVKKFLRTNSQRVKVILMSATFDSSTFADYFSLSPQCHPAPIVEITGKSKDVTEHYLHELKTLLKTVPEFDMSNPKIDEGLYDAVLKLMCVFDRIEKAEQNVPSEQEFAPSRGAVLIFLPGYEEISKLTDKLLTASFNKNFWIIPLHSSITVDEQTKVFRDSPADQRKVIISTNIAESSITVPDVKYVIDFCLTKNLVTDPYTNYTCLQLEWASKANCIQRKGRAGRVDIGKVYRMVPRQFYDELPEYGVPEIKRCPLTSTILHLKKLNLCEPQEMLAFALDPPDLCDIGTAVLQLKEGLALTSRGCNPFDGDLTFIGRVMANLPLDIKLSKLIIFGYVFHCLKECIIIAASLSLQSFFVRPFQKALDAYRSRLAWADKTFSDCLCYLNAYNEWKQQSIQASFRRPGGQSEKAWAEKHFIQLKRIREVDMLVKEINNRLEKLQIIVNHRQQPHEEDNLILKMVIAGAFFPNYFIQEQLDEETINKDLNENDPHSTVLVTGLPPKHGILYASALKDLFATFSKNIMIEFEESKAYVRFHRDHETNSSTVLQAVYLAVKMRKLRLPLELAVFSQNEAERKWKQLMSSFCQKEDNRLASNRITVKYTGASALQKVEMPPLERSTIDIFISHVNNCGHFWARYITPKINAEYRFLETTINHDQGRNLKPLSKPVQPNILYLAPFADESGQIWYYRAQVQEKRGGKALVFFVDYGNVDSVDIKDLREIDESTPDVLHTPALAVECYLSEVKPSSLKNSNGTWCPEAIAWFKRTVSGYRLYAKIYSVVQDTLRLELMGKNLDLQIQSINKLLIAKGFAEPAEENRMSKQNHEQRTKAIDYTSREVSHENLSKDVEVSWQDAEEFDHLQKTGRKIRLHGPFNPLEVSYSGLTSIDRSKCVKVERDSVNSVSINAEPQDPYTNVLVAASVSVGQSNLELIARNTTLMPKIRGLPSLICLLFSPYVEIRTDKGQRSYIGALCGLGYDPETEESLYPDHDIEIAFDVELTLLDINAINCIRMGFNMLLNSDCDTLLCTSNSTIHRETRKAVIGLLQKKRQPREAEFFKKEYQWNQVSPGLLLEAIVENRADCPYVLPLIKPPSLSSFEDKRKDIVDHLEQLAILAEPPNKPLNNIMCQLCLEQFHSSRDLLLHLDSEKHINKEEMWKK